jgi:8-oxo-dGTP diphosphatase
MDWDHDIDGQANWEDLRFCPRCARELGHRELRGHARLTCAGCGYILYVSPAPVTCVLVERERRVLLVRRRYPPGAGKWCLPAGFVEVGEPPSESAAREVKEETGLDVEIGPVLDTWASEEDHRTPIVCIAYEGGIKGGTLRPGDDATEAAFFAADELPDDIAFGSHRRTIERHFRDTGGRGPSAGRPRTGKDGR